MKTIFHFSVLFLMGLGLMIHAPAARADGGNVSGIWSFESSSHWGMEAMHGGTGQTFLHMIQNGDEITVMDPDNGWNGMGVLMLDHFEVMMTGSSGSGMDAAFYQFNLTDFTSGHGTYEEGYSYNNGMFMAQGGHDFNMVKVSSFVDMPMSHWAHDDAEDLFASGITYGCANGYYCPDEDVTRAQMAVFMERVMNGGDFMPGPAMGVFSDVGSMHWAGGWIEQLYQDGITLGCNDAPLAFCPDSSVTRAEMAVFVLRTMYGGSYRPPAATGVFADVGTMHWGADWIEQMYSEGITDGCATDPLRFCPDEPVTRAEMAAFMTRAFSLGGGTGAPGTSPGNGGGHMGMLLP